MKALLRITLTTILFASSAHAMGLKENSIVTGEFIRLGDIFYGLDQGEDKVLGNAPAPGKDMVLNSRTLKRVAVAMGLSWRPTSIADRVVLTRQGTFVEPEIVRSALKDAVRAQGVVGKFDLVFNIRDMILPPDQPAAVEIGDLDVRSKNNWFKATLYAPSKSNPIIRKDVSGTIQRLVDVPVLSRAFTNGDVIRAGDIEIASLPERDIQGRIILSENQLIGMTPRRLVGAHKPVKTDDLQAPMLIERGEIITMTYTHGLLNLTARGKALESGAKDEMIRVVNLGSNQTIEAQITGTQDVIVTAF